MALTKGQYNGFYQFDNNKITKSLGFDKTYFTIEITDLDEKHFKGWVEDNRLNGGMEGRGTISGNINGNKVWFVKKMPYLTQLVKDSETGNYRVKIDKTKKHKPIYYKGIEIENNYYKGEYNFKYFGIVINILMWLKIIKTGGNWEMSKIN